jgi:hypothetical protein
LINSDSPTVPQNAFAEAATVLARPGDRVVLGPSDDGGYYLIGFKKMLGCEKNGWGVWLNEFIRVVPREKVRSAKKSGRTELRKVPPASLS